ncbi:MAG: C_GCAxxG_C_C family protein [Methanomicrobia archaeon]|nr:C_GCAxxG_C_C family protein [Methanomicrobia archaeon]
MDEEIKKRVYNLAFEYEKRYGNCPQSIFAAVGEVFGFMDDEVFKSAAGLAGGCALSTNGTCGALTGGVMIIGYKYGRNYEEYKKGKRGMKAYKLSKKLYDRFIEEYGTCTCKGVQEKIFGRSYDLWDAKDYKKFDDAGAHEDKCTDIVGKTAIFVAEILLEED